MLSYFLPFPAGAHIFGATICSDGYGARYYIEIRAWIEPKDMEVPSIRYAHVIGLDYAQDGLCMDSAGNSAGYPAYRQRARSELERCKRAANRFHPGSHRSRKFKRCLAKSDGISVTSARAGNSKRQTNWQKFVMGFAWETWILQRCSAVSLSLPEK